MASIDPQIDAALPQMKARAVMFDDRHKTIDDWVSQVGAGKVLDACLSAADSNLSKARTDMAVRAPIGPRYQRRQILDTMNLCAMALSLLPGGEHE